PGMANAHAPDGAGAAGALEQLTYIHATYAVSAAPDGYSAIQSMAVGAAMPLHVAVTLFPAVTAAGLAGSVAGAARAARAANACAIRMRGFVTLPPGRVSAIGRPVCCSALRIAVTDAPGAACLRMAHAPVT